MKKALAQFVVTQYLKMALQTPEAHFTNMD